jgi:hypothetical protein
VRLASAAGRWVLAVAVLGEAMVLLEATVVNVALPAIGRDLGGGVAGLQWTLNGYVLTLAALVLPAGSLSDLYGRRRVFILGVGAFVAASALCAAAPTIQLLVAARFGQGVGGALLTPGSLAIIDAVFHPDDRTRAIGAWAGLTAVAAAVGPPVGGYLTDALSWRAVFLINLPVGAFVIVAAVVRVPESRDPMRAGGLDLRGAALAALAIAALCFALIQASGGLTPAVIAAAAVSLAAAGRLDAEQVVLGVGEHGPSGVRGLARVRRRCAQGQEPVHRCRQVACSQIHVQPVLAGPRVARSPEHHRGYPVIRVVRGLDGDLITVGVRLGPPQRGQPEVSQPARAGALDDQVVPAQAGRLRLVRLAAGSRRRPLPGSVHLASFAKLAEPGQPRLRSAALDPRDHTCHV